MKLTTAINGVGYIGSALARHLVGRGEPVVNGALLDLGEARAKVAPAEVSA